MFYRVVSEFLQLVVDIFSIKNLQTCKNLLIYTFNATDIFLYTLKSLIIEYFKKVQKRLVT